MDRIGQPALRGTWLGALLRAWNPAMRRLLGSPLHWPLSRWFALLEYTGRKTVRRYVTPVSYVRQGGTVYLTSGDRWTVNLSSAAPVRLRLRGRWLAGVGRLVTDREESIREHGRLFGERPFFRRLAGVSGTRDGGAEPADVARAVDAGRRLVRIELDEPDA